MSFIVYPSLGLYWIANVDPTIAPGVSAPLNQLLFRTDSASLYYKSSAANTGWTLLGVGSAAVTTIVNSIVSTTVANDIFGDGSDGVQNFDGVSNVLGIVPAAGVYTLIRPIYLADGSTLPSGVTIQPNGHQILVKGELLGTGIVARVGNAGQAGALNSHGLGGTAAGTGTLPQTIAGGVGNGVGGGVSGSAPRGFTAGAGGAFGAGGTAGQPGGGGTVGGVGQGGGGGGGGGHGAGTGGAGTAGGTVTILPITNGDIRTFPNAVHARPVSSATSFSGASGGAGGGPGGNGGGGVAGAGGGGAGGGYVVLCAKKLDAGLTVRVKGGAGGVGAVGSAANGGGGGGGAGGGGGVAVVYTADGNLPIFDLSGGPAGAGGLKNGTGGNGGNGGDGGTGIKITS